MSEPDQVQVPGDGSVVIAGAVARKDRGPCAGADRLAPPVDVAAGGQQDVPAGQLPRHASTSRSWEVKAFILPAASVSISPGQGFWPGEITSGTYHGRLPPVTPGTWPPPAADPRLPAPSLHTQSGTSNIFLETV